MASTSPLASTAASRHRPPLCGGDNVFALISADDVVYHFRLTPHMCAESFYLQAASDIEAVDGVVPVGSAQAIRDYVTYLQYTDLRHQLGNVLAQERHTARERMQDAAPLAISTGVSTAGPPSAPSNAHHRDDHHLPPLVAQRGRRLRKARAAESTEAAWMSPLIVSDGARGEDVVLDEQMSDFEKLFQDVMRENRYVLQHLDCDRTYAQHADKLRHWRTVSELAAYRGEAAPTHEEAEEAESNAAMGAAARQFNAAPPAASAGTGSEGEEERTRARALAASDDDDDAYVSLHPHTTAPLRSRSPSTLSSSSTSSSISSVSEPSVAAFKAAAARAAASPAGAPAHGVGQRPGYGAHLTLDEPDGIFFVEHVLLSHEWLPGNRPYASAEHREDVHNTKAGEEKARKKDRDADVLATSSTKNHGGPAAATQADAAPMQPSAVLLSAHQQRRLLELIAVADFMGTQPLVELCANYLAAWLMDSTDDEIVESFLVFPDPEGRGGVPQRKEWTDNTNFQELWMRLVDTPTGASGATVKTLSGGAGAPAAASPATAAAQNAPATTRAETKVTAKKKGAAAANARSAAWKGKTGKAAKNAEDTKNAGKEENEEEGSGSAAAAAGIDSAFSNDLGAGRRLLSGDQRLSVVRQMKRDGSITVTPY